MTYFLGPIFTIVFAVEERDDANIGRLLADPRDYVSRPIAHRAVHETGR